MTPHLLFGSLVSAAKKQPFGARLAGPCMRSRHSITANRRNEHAGFGLAAKTKFDIALDLRQRIPSPPASKAVPPHL